MPAPGSAMVFAAGLGTRMRPVTDALPKPLVPVAGRTLLDHMLDRLAQAGVGRAVVNVHYRADQIEAHLAGRAGAPEVRISDERARLLDQAGGIRRALPLLGPGPFAVCNTDALWVGGDAALPRLFAGWDPDRMDVLLLVAERAGAVGVDWPGDFSMGRDGRLDRRAEGGEAPLVYAGVGMLKPEPYAALADGDPVRLAPFFFEAAARGRLFGTRLDGRWLHVGTPAAIGEAEAAMAASRPG